MGVETNGRLEFGGEKKKKKKKKIFDPLVNRLRDSQKDRGWDKGYIRMKKKWGFERTVD